MRLAQRPRNGIDYMIDQRDIAPFRAFDAARKLRNINHRGSCFLGDSFSSAAIQVRINYDDVHLILSHLRDDFSEVRWRRGNPWLRLKEQIDLQAEAIAKIEPGVVISDDLLAFELRKYPLPLG